MRRDRDVPKNASRPSRDQDVRDQDYKLQPCIGLSSIHWRTINHYGRPVVAFWHEAAV